MSKNITHDGVVVKVEGRTVAVRIVQLSACSGCHARGACTASDSKEKIIEADSMGQEFAIGEQVTIVGSNQMAWSALTYAFIIPLVVSMTVLFVGALQWSEAVGALSVIGFLVVYYWGLYLMRDRLKTKFTFTLRKKC